jgi:hypothetical protein
MKHLATAPIAIMLAASPALAIDGLRFGSIDSTLGIEAVSAELDAVVEGQSPKFASVVSGKDADNRSVLMGGNTDAVEMMSVTWKGGLAPNDLRSIGDIEEEFGLAGVDRLIREACDPAVYADKALQCTQIDYDCKGDICPVTILSFYTDGQKETGIVRVGWLRGDE